MEDSGRNGIGFTGLLQILFIALKLTGFIDWTWLWVLSPIWISTLIFIIGAVIVVIGAIIED